MTGAAGRACLAVLGLAAVVAAAAWRPAAAGAPLRIALDGERATVVFAGRVAAAPESVLTLAVDGARDAVAGSYETTGSGLVFHPLYPLEPGVTYRAVARTGHDSVTVALTMPGPRAGAPAVITGILPAGDTLPSNLLRLSVTFSRPMRVGEAAGHLRLLDGGGRVMHDVFWGFEPELWDATHRRLTVLLDPGRIKRGLRPNVELGPPLEPGRRYRLLVDSGWPDEDGTPLAHGFEKSFVTVPPRRAALDLSSWSVESPAPGSDGPVVLRSPVALDAALAVRLISVIGARGIVPVRISLRDGDRTILLGPRAAWEPGRYRVIIVAALEDVAGNSFQRAFDRDLRDPTDLARDDLAEVSLSFHVGSVALVPSARTLQRRR